MDSGAIEMLAVRDSSLRCAGQERLAHGIRTSWRCYTTCSAFRLLPSHGLAIPRFSGARPLGVGWIALVLGSLIGFVASANPSAALSRLGAVLAAVSVFCWLRASLRTPRRLYWSSWVLVAVCAAGALAVL